MSKFSPDSAFPVGCGELKCHVQVLHMQTLGGPSPTGGREPQPGWMALYPKSRYMLTLASAAARLACGPSHNLKTLLHLLKVFMFQPWLEVLLETHLHFGIDLNLASVAGHWHYHCLGIMVLQFVKPSPSSVLAHTKTDLQARQ